MSRNRPPLMMVPTIIGACLICYAVGGKHYGRGSIDAFFHSMTHAQRVHHREAAIAGVLLMAVGFLNRPRVIVDEQA